MPNSSPPGNNPYLHVIKTIQQKAEEALADVQKQMKDMETIHLFHLKPKWERLRAQEEMLYWLLHEGEQGKFFEN